MGPHQYNQSDMVFQEIFLGRETEYRSPASERSER